MSEALTREERRRQSMLAPNCEHCPNKARLGSPMCRACEERMIAKETESNLTRDFHEIAHEAETLDDPYSDVSPRDVLRLVKRLAEAMAQARDS